MPAASAAGVVRFGPACGFALAPLFQNAVAKLPPPNPKDLLKSCRLFHERSKDPRRGLSVFGEILAAIAGCGGKRRTPGAIGLGAAASIGPKVGCGQWLVAATDRLAALCVTYQSTKK